jgi:hypothetical protein
MLRLLLSVVTLSAIAASAQATVLTRCGPSKGYAYYFPTPLVANNQAGWRADGISNGGLQVIVDGQDYDIVFTDAFGTRSARADGFVVMRVPGPRILLLSMNLQTGVVEHYLFNLDAAGRGTVLLGSIRSGEPLPKSSLMKADCTGP